MIQVTCWLLVSGFGNIALAGAAALRALPLWAKRKMTHKTTPMWTIEVINRFLRNVGVVSTVEAIALPSLGGGLGDYAHFGNAGITNCIHYPDKLLNLQLMVSLNDDPHARVLALQVAYL